jgi:murein L,D-transpeptidase YcbB/YkuD
MFVSTSQKQRAGRSGWSKIVSPAAVAAAAVLAVSAPIPVSGFQANAQASRQAPGGSAQAVSAFYAARGWQPLWLGRPGRQVDVLLEILDSSQLDGLNPRRYRIGSLQKAVRAARSGDPRAVRRADMMLSQALADYARDLGQASKAGVIYVDEELRPSARPARAILDGAASAPSLERYVAGLGWMHPLYGQLRYGLMSGAYSNRADRARIMLNLERARAMPLITARHVLVNAAAQRLYVYEGSQVVDTMRVVAGKPSQPTPMMAGFIRYTSLNPYWNVPPDLAATIIAPNVLKRGTGYLKQKGYQVLSNWSDKAKILDPKSINWKAVAAGQEQVRVRQLPGPSNSMGSMKFMFPNREGIYLHDTPRDELFDEASRLLSAGCVRLQDAPRLAQWLHGKSLKPQRAKAEQKVAVEDRVPVYITYMTVMPSGSNVAYFPDLYGWDARHFAQAART